MVDFCCGDQLILSFEKRGRFESWIREIIIGLKVGESILQIKNFEASSSGNLGKKKKMQTRYMERTNSMREKRKLEEDDSNNQQPERKRPALAR